jgi:hypothetical protein
MKIFWDNLSPLECRNKNRASMPGILIVRMKLLGAVTRFLAEIIAQVVRKARMPQPPKSFFFKLADSFAAQPKFIRNFL